MEFIVALLLLACAILVIVAAVRRWPRPVPEKIEEPLPVAHSLLPRKGSPGSATSAQLASLHASGLEGFDFEKLSREQAQILIDGAKYLDDVWVQEFKLDRAAQPPAAREKALEWLLSHESFIERAVVFEEAHDLSSDEELPKDTCYWHIAGLFREAK